MHLRCRIRLTIALLITFAGLLHSNCLSVHFHWNNYGLFVTERWIANASSGTLCSYFMYIFQPPVIFYHSLSSTYLLHVHSLLYILLLALALPQQSKHLFIFRHLSSQSSMDIKETQQIAAIHISCNLIAGRTLSLLVADWGEVI